MTYRAVLSRRAEKAFLDLPIEQAKRVKEAIRGLELEPRGQATIKLDYAPVAQYRCRVGNLRILFDIDDGDRIVEILDIRKRDEQTYR
ncbi:MAG: type II toxin-antitoxin system RelE/ParE family toxin [Chloroflexota bacterium]|nr:MAG: type II toxin-antitoxin system RelE/ParE family toxin [Chloroflexota bacterium]